jgi:hypothetical protein
MNLSWRIWAGAVVLVAAVALIWTRIPWLRHPAPPAAIPDRNITSPLNVPGGGTAPPEAYEVYSALYREPADEPLVFPDDSVTDIPQVNGTCLKPSTPEERELTAAFEAANQQMHRWEQKFTIAQGYQLLNRNQVSEAQGCLQTHMRDAARCAPYKQVRHVRFLGVPGFDRTHTHALVSVVKMCGRYCGNGGIFEVEKAGGTWRRSEPSNFTRECSWMY